MVNLREKLYIVKIYPFSLDVINPMSRGCFSLRLMFSVLNVVNVFRMYYVRTTKKVRIYKTIIIKLI